MTSERFDELRANAESDVELISHSDVIELIEEVSRLSVLAYVPGGWRCPKCNFQLTKSALYAKSGNVGIDYRAPELCPNDGTKMEPQTWEADARAMAERIPDSLAMGMIHDLRKNEGAAVTILCDNPDPDDANSMCAVEVCDEWTGWRDLHFTGKDVREALWKARSAMYEATRGPA